MIIDAHQHFWTYDAAHFGWITDDMKSIRRNFHPGHLEPVLQQCGVSGTVVVQVDESIAETEALLSLSESNPFIKAVVGWVDLKDPRLEDTLRFLKAKQKLKGFRAILQGNPDGRYLSHPDFQAGVRKLKAFGFTYDVLIYHDQMDATARFLEKCPDQPLILDHIAKPAIRDGEIRKWKEHMKLLASFPNLYCKLSGMVTEARWDKWRYEDLSPYLDIAGEYFGTGRLCYGSDWPVCLVAGKYEQVLGVVQRFLQQVTPAERDKVLAGNALTFYNIN
jgi:L-fuconolactonase